MAGYIYLSHLAVSPPPLLPPPPPARTKGWDLDIVCPVPDGSRPAAIQIAAELGLPYREGLVKNRWGGGVMSHGLDCTPAGGRAGGQVRGCTTEGEMQE